MSDNCHCVLFSDNQPIVLWVRQMSANSLLVVSQLLRALVLRLEPNKVSPLTSLHIWGKEISITDIPSCSFGIEPQWHCKTDAGLLALFNTKPPPPPAILNSIPLLQDNYKGNFAAADLAYYNGRVVQTNQYREVHWKNWCCYVEPVRVDPYLQKTLFTKRMRFLFG